MISDPVSIPSIVEINDFDLLEHARDVSLLSDEAPHKNLACSADVWSSIFFDGTGNNRNVEMKRPLAQRGLSNVAKLHDIHQPSDKLTGIALTYVPGVGTPFAEIGDSGGGLGGGTGYMGAERLDWAEKQIQNAIAIQQQQGFKVKNIHLAVFGFSRGATLARAFVNRISKKCKMTEGQSLYNEMRLRIYFLGIFDTVASVGLPREHETYAESLGIPSIVDTCIHLTAGHELRFAFPLDSTRRNGKYDSGSVEYVFPGVHSDVGGGYFSDESGISNEYEAVPLNFMFKQARNAGVPFRKISDWTSDLAKNFAISRDLKKRFNAYMGALDSTAGSLEEATFEHLKLYWRYRKLRLNDASAPIPQRLKALQQAADASNRTLAGEYNKLTAEETSYYRDKSSSVTKENVSDDEERQAAISNEEDINNSYKVDRAYWKQADEEILDEAHALSRLVLKGNALSWQRAIWDAWMEQDPLPDDVVAFFDNYIHDSQADWNHHLDTVDVMIHLPATALTCSAAFSKKASAYCGEMKADNHAGMVEFLRPRTMFFGPKEDVFAVADTGY